MEIATLKGEKTVREFVRRIFERELPVEQEQIVRFEEALVKANPFLTGNISKIPPGTIVRLPKGIDLDTPLEGHPLEPIARDLIQQIQNVLANELPLQFDRTLKKLVKDTENNLELLKSRKFQALAEEDPVARISIDDLVRKGEATREEEEKLKIQNLQILQQLNDNFDLITTVLNPKVRSRISEL